MAELDPDLLQHWAQGRTFSDPMCLIWGVHEGSRGARWIVVGEDGRVKESRYHPSAQSKPESRELGRVDPQAVCQLAHALHQVLPTLDALAREGPADPAQCLSLEFCLGEDRAEWRLPHHDDLRVIGQAFDGLATQAAHHVKPAVLPPLSVSIAPGMWMLLGLIGTFTLGVGALGLWFTWRTFPRLLDAEGVTTRAGRRYAWTELTLRTRVMEGNTDIVLGYDLMAGGQGVVRIAPKSITQGAEVITRIRSATASTEA